MDKKITADDCAQEVRLMARRAALLHYYFSKTIIDELGEEEGEALINKAIWAYGQHCGSEVREGVMEMGLPTTEENYGQIRDLPKFGWEVATVTPEDGVEREVVTHCPLAGTFQELGTDGEKLGRLYCYVDQAKYQAYNPEMAFVHDKNVLDGDTNCEFVIKVLLIQILLNQLQLGFLILLYSFLSFFYKF